MTSAALVEECFPQYRNAAAILKTRRAEAAQYESFAHGLEREIHLDHERAVCPQDERFYQRRERALVVRTNGSNPLLFPKSGRSPFATDRECYRAKVEALVQIQGEAV